MIHCAFEELELKLCIVVQFNNVALQYMVMVGQCWVQMAVPNN